MTQKEYARRKGVSPQAVNKRVKAGRLSVLPDGTIDPAAADREWAATASPPGPEMEGKRITAGVGPAVGHAGAGAAAAGSPAPAPATGTYAQAKTADALFKAKLRQLDYESRTGAYVKTAEVERRWFELAQGVRKRMMAIPDRLAAELAATTDTHQVRRRLDEEVRSALHELVDDARRSA